MDANASIKMADKRALVAAVKNALPIVGELFTQDIEEKWAERTKGNIQNRRLALFEKIRGLLVQHKSPMAETHEEFLKKSVPAVLGPVGKLSTHGAIDEYEKAIDSGKINFKTGELNKAQ
jgi:hypothetical protein